MTEFFNYFTQTSGESMTASAMALTLLCSLVSGLLIGLTYEKTNKNELIQRNFILTLLMLPLVMSAIILFVGSNVARAFSLAGTVSIIRFRSAPGDPKEIGYIFFSVAAGLCAGIGMFGYGLAFVVIVCLIMLLIEKSPFGKQHEHMRMLKITIPEDLNYHDAFAEPFQKFTEKQSLYAVKTADLGSVFILTYHILLKKDANEKELINELRCRNGNLDITYSEIPAVVR